MIKINIYDQYLEQNNITRYKVSKLSGVYASTLQVAADSNKLDNMSVRILKATATALDKTPGQVLDEMIELENSNN